MKTKWLFLGLILLIDFNTAISQNVWQKNIGPQGAAVLGIAVNAKGDKFISINGGGLIRLAHNTDSLISLNTGSKCRLSGIPCIGAGGDLFLLACDGSYRSSDNGNSWSRWTRADSGDLYQRDLKTIAFNTNSDAFLGTDLGIYRSTNNGKNWKMIGFVLSQIKAIAINKKGYIFATVGVAYKTSSGIFRSTDNGETWTRCTLTIDGSFGETLCLAINSTGDIFAGCEAGILRSSDDGGNWWPLDMGLGPSAYPYVSELAINTRGHIFAGTLGGVFRSTNNGNNWTEINAGLINLQTSALNIDSSGTIYAGTQNALFRSSDNGDHWTEITKDMPSRPVTSVVITAKGNILANADNDFFVSSDGGSSWYHTRFGYNGMGGLSFGIKNNGHIFAGGYGIIRSIDDGISWTSIQDSFPEPTISAVAVHPNGDVFAGTFNGVCRSTDEGDHWKHLESSFLSDNIAVMSLAINKSGTIFAGAVNGGGRMYRSTDNGDHWASRNIGLSLYYVSSIAICENGNIYAGADMSTGIFRSTDNGDTWRETSLGLTDRRVYALAVNKFGYVYAGTDTAVFCSKDDGEHWIKMSFEFPIVGVRALAIDQDGHVFAGTNRGLFRSSEFLTETPAVPHILPLSFSLRQNYPNPFNPLTTISFDLPSKGFVCLKVLNLLGQEVVTLVSEELSAGKHSVQWNAINIASGIYFYRLQSGSLAETKKLILLR